MSVARGSWTQVIASGLTGGAVINLIEWTAHRVWLGERWARAFVALGKAPSYWTVFVIANFGVGIVAVWAYRWLATFYGRKASTAARVAVAMWIVFWIVPILGMQPFDLFPNSLLAAVVGVGAVDACVGIGAALWMFDRIS